MLVKDTMTTKVVAIKPKTTLEQAAHLMLRSHISGLPVLDFDRVLVGIVTKGDLLWNSALATEEHRPWWIQGLLAVDRLTGAAGRRNGHMVS
jgi:CBS-domain-containing membrane protein